MIILDLIKKVVDDYGDDTFIVERELYRRKEFTYRQVYNRALGLSKLFEDKKIKKGDKVLIYSLNSVDYATTLWACAISGVVVVPIDFNNNFEFVKKIYNEVGASAIFCSVLKDPLCGNRIFFESLDEYYDKDLEGFAPDYKIKEDDVFEIVYTSGTTADPKGVVLTNKNIVSNINSIRNIIEFKARDVSLLSVLPLSHLFEQTVGFFLPMVKNYSIVYISSKKASSISSAIEEEKINAMVTVPLFLNSLKSKIETLSEEKGKLEKLNEAIEKFENYPKLLKRIVFRKVRKKFRTIEYFIVGGSSLDASVEKFWETMGIDVLQGYGLTESSPILTSNMMKNKKLGTVGRAIEGVTVKIKDSEIIAKGDNVFSGYYKNKVETRKILKNGWMYTGDIGTIDEDGFLKITGRKKNMILSPSGVNVYPEDVEAVLNKLKGVKESVVLGLNNGEDIVGVILSDNKINEGSMLKSANSKLSQHQYLSRIYQWKELDFPRTPTKKVKRRFVEEGIVKKAKKSGKADDDLINIISKVCDVDFKKVKENTLLKNLGLDSLKRLELSMDIEEILNVDFNEDEITGTTTVKDVRELIKSTKVVKVKSGINFLNSRFFNPLRFVLQWITFILTRISYKTKVVGLENIPEEQCIFVANHTSHLDTIEIMRALNTRKRMNTGFAAAKDVFFEGSFAWTGPLFRLSYNTFPFARDTGIKQSLIDFGTIVDRGFNVVIFPEGTRTTTDKMGKFKNGIGLIVWNMGLPVVPIKLNGLFEIMPKGQFYWKPSLKGVEMKIGKPIKFSKMQSSIEITKKLEEAVRKL